MNIFFDLDGTLIDASIRIHQLFEDLTGSHITYDEYWKLKRMLFSNEEIVKSKFRFSNKQVIQFLDNWMIQIEDEKYLKMDKLFSFTKETLENFVKKNCNLYVITNRQKVAATLNQLKLLDIMPFFQDIFITEQKIKKIKLLELKITHFEPYDYLVSDDFLDIDEFNKHQIKTIAVLSGMGTREIFEKHIPHMITDNIESFYLALKDQPEGFLPKQNH